MSEKKKARPTRDNLIIDLVLSIPPIFYSIVFLATIGVSNIMVYLILIFGFAYIIQELRKKIKLLKSEESIDFKKAIMKTRILIGLIMITPFLILTFYPVFILMLKGY